MKTRTLALGTAFAASLLATNDALAAGTALDVQSARGTGMAASMTAMVDDSSAIFYNPAGIANGRKLDAQLGVSLIAPTFSYTDTAGNKTTMPFSVVPPVHAYVASTVVDNLAVGIGVFNPYGLKIGWPEGWAGRRLVTDASLYTYYINPTVAYRLGPVRLGAGFQLVRATVHLQRNVGFGDQEGSVDLGGDAWGVGANVGAQVDAIQKYLTFGVHYRSAVKLNFDGKAHFDNVPPTLAGTIHDQAVTTSVINPDQLAFGVASRPIDKLVLDADLVWLGWGSFRSIDINFPDDKSGSLASTQPKRWSSGVNFHLGGEGIIHPNFRVRAGFLYDPTPSPDDTLTPDLPDANRLNIAVGGSYVHETGFRVDLGYQYLILFSHKSTSPQFPGEYGGLVNILGITVGYQMPLPEKKPAEPPPPDPSSTPPPAETAPPSGTSAPPPTSGPT